MTTRLRMEPESYMKYGSAEDRLCIADLFSRYAWGMDRVDRTAFESIWTTDAVWTAEGVDIHCVGLAAIMAYFDATSATRVPVPGVGGCVRFCSTPIIDFSDADHAASRSELVAFRNTGTAVAPYSIGYYEDALVRVDGRWLIRHRTMVVNPPAA
ncbi:nuclear transport factor 2 family protein [Nocardia sp. R6R-6]|uniref:nuclear transport factor 2 family protein n=1 Tax=Nocardia sp. R6R-6 TaxID=3459303 RepID=UPI00403D826C